MLMEYPYGTTMFIIEIPMVSCWNTIILGWLQSKTSQKHAIFQ
jgi:hypothetical protein